MIFHPVNNKFLELPILALLCLNVGQQSNSDGLEGRKWEEILLVIINYSELIRIRSNRDYVRKHQMLQLN